MDDLKASPEIQRPSAAELRKLPPAERTSVLQAQAELAEGLYRRNSELMGFETFDEGEIRRDGSDFEAW